MRPKCFSLLPLTSILAALTLALPVCAAGKNIEKTIEVGEIERDYLLHVPASYSKDKSAPLVFVFHGGGSTAQVAARMKFSEVSDREGFIVVYPDAVSKNWNDGRNDPLIKSQRERVDDIGFVTALIDELSREYKIDPKRIYSTGASNGGIMLNRIGAELSDRFAAIAPVIGGMAPSVAENFHPTHPISVMIINGTEDPLVPFEGGRVTFLGRGRGNIIPTAETVQKWVAHNGCNPKPVARNVPDKDSQDGTRSSFADYTGGKNGTEVIFYTVEGGGHTWPGGKQYLPVKMIGRVSRDFDATETIWEFFKTHPKS